MTVAESADAEWISACQREKSSLLLTLYVKRCDATPLRFFRHQGCEPEFKDASSDTGRMELFAKADRWTEGIMVSR
jgi:hypothetical protein